MEVKPDEQRQAPAHSPDRDWYANFCNCHRTPHLKSCHVAWLNEHQPDKDKVPVETVDAGDQ